MIEDILNRINVYRRGKLTDDQFKRYQETMYIKKTIGKEVYDNTKKKYDNMLETIRFNHDGPCFIEIKRAENEELIMCLYKSFMYGKEPYYESYDRTIKVDLTSELFRSVLLLLSDDYKKNGKLELSTFDKISEKIKREEWYLYTWSIPLKF